MQQKHVYNLTFWCTCPIPPMCVRRLAPVSLAAAPSHDLPKGTISMGAAGCRPAVGAKIIEIGVNAIQKWVQFTPKCSQKRWRLGLRPRPPIARDSAFGSYQSDTPMGKGRQFPSSPRAPETLGTPLYEYSIPRLSMMTHWSS